MEETPSPHTNPSPPAAEVSTPRWPPASQRARRLRWAVTGLVALAIIATAGGLWWSHTTPQRVDRQQTLVVGQTQFAPGSESAVRVIVYDAKARRPVPDADVRLSLAPEGGGPATALFSGKAGADGALAATFAVPEGAEAGQTLVVEARSSAGHDEVRQAVAVERSYKLLLTTDKPVYQPGQAIHMRALAFSTLDMQAAAGSDIGFLVEDPKGNKVFRQTVPASPYGIAAADFTLASEVIHGDYKLTVSLGDTATEKTVSVKPYVLPKFAVKASTARSYYLPGERVAGTVQCDYFFGKPATDAAVDVVGSVFDVQETEVVRIQGHTDERGTYTFEFDLPTYFAGGGLEQEQAELSLQVSVRDQAGHVEQASHVLPIAEDPLLIDVVAEAGVLKPGVENRLYILTAYPDGRPAQCRILGTLAGQPLDTSSGEHGLAEVAFVPPAGPTRLALTASDAQGHAAQKTVELAADQGAAVVLLRPDRATYRLGETMHLVVLASQGSVGQAATPASFGSVYLDIVRDGQTLSTRSAPAQDGRAEFAVDLSGDLFGTLVLHAYKVLPDGSIIRDTRIVVVDAPRDLETEISAGREVYRPGETATLSFQTRSAAAPVQAALGVAIVDESVFAVMEQDPGFAKLYFLLQKELLEPKYKVAGFTLPEVLTETERTDLAATRDLAARAAWAPIPASAMAMSLDSRPAKIKAAEQGREAGLNRVVNVTLVLLILLPLGLWAAAIAGLHATGILGRALGRFGLALVVLAFVAPLACSGLFALLAVVAGLSNELGPRLVALVMGGFLLGWLAAFVALAVYAWARRDERARIVWLLVVAWVALGAILIVTLVWQATPNGWLAALAVIAYLAGLAALLLFGIGLYVEGRHGPAAATIGLVLLFVPAVIAAAALPAMAQNGVVRTLGSPVVYAGPVTWLSGCAAGPGSNVPGLPLPGFGMLNMGKSQEVAPPTQPEAPAREAAAQAPRVRQFFPETLLWLPELETDTSGFASLEVPLADSITTWRVTALASTQDGKLGFAHAGLRVFQDFFVDIDLPVALTQNDEVAIPVAVYNYLPDAQEVRLQVAAAPWFELLDEPEKSVEIAANDIDVVYFRIRVLQFGEQAFQVTALGERMSDAIKRQVSVVPDGRRFRDTQSDWLRRGATVTAQVPAEAITGTGRLEVKIYPGAVSQVIEGLESILKLPYG